MFCHKLTWRWWIVIKWCSNVCQVYVTKWCESIYHVMTKGGDKCSKLKYTCNPRSTHVFRHKMMLKYSSCHKMTLKYSSCHKMTLKYSVTKWPWYTLAVTKWRWNDVINVPPDINQEVHMCLLTQLGGNIPIEFAVSLSHFIDFLDVH